LLDRGRRFVVFGRQRLQKGRAEAEFSKSGHFSLSNTPAAGRSTGRPMAWPVRTKGV
jgi:hypothetical protein